MKWKRAASNFACLWSECFGIKQNLFEWNKQLRITWSHQRWHPLSETWSHQRAWRGCRKSRAKVKQQRAWNEAEVKKSCFQWSNFACLWSECFGMKQNLFEWNSMFLNWPECFWITTYCSKSSPLISNPGVPNDLCHQGSAEVVSELTELLSQLRKEPEGPELFRMNDRANELLKLLPLQLLVGEHGGTSWHRSDFCGSESPPPKKMGIF